MVSDLNLLEEEISWKGEAGGNVRPLKAMVLWFTMMHPPPHLYHSPNQLWATTVGHLWRGGTAKWVACLDWQ